MSTTVKTRSRLGALLLATALAGSMLIGSTSRWGPSASDAAPGAPAAPAQAATCVEATNSEHADAGRAWEFLIFVFARGSFAYMGLSWTTTSLQEGPTGTWNMVESCGGGPDGAAIYAANCAVCHGPEGEGGVGPSLQGVGAHGREPLIEVVTNGRGEMPAWAGRLTPEEIGAVVDYISTFEGDHHGNPTTTTTTGGTTTTTGGTTTTTHGGHDH